MTDRYLYSCKSELSGDANLGRFFQRIDDDVEKYRDGVEVIRDDLRIRVVHNGLSYGEYIADGRESVDCPITLMDLGPVTGGYAGLRITATAISIGDWVRVRLKGGAEVTSQDPLMIVHWALDEIEGLMPLKES